MPEASRKRWHAAIAELSSLQFKHSLDAVAVGQAVEKHLRNKKCEGCDLKLARFGLPEGKKRWCSGCAKAHVGAVDVVSKKCEGCGLKHPNYGLPSEGTRKRWCLGCAPKVAVASGRRRKAEDLLWANKPKAADPSLTMPGI